MTREIVRDPTKQTQIAGAFIREMNDEFDEVSVGAFDVKTEPTTASVRLEIDLMFYDEAVDMPDLTVNNDRS